MDVDRMIADNRTAVETMLREIAAIKRRLHVLEDTTRRTPRTP